MNNKAASGPLKIDAERNKARMQRARFSALLAGASRAVTILTSFISIPLVSGHLSKDEFGIWVVITGMMSLLTFADLGIGNGLINTIARCHGKNDKEGIRRAVLNAFVALSCVGTFIAIISVAAAFLIDIGDIFRIEEEEIQAETLKTIILFLLIFCVSIPLNVAAKTQIGLQQGYINGLMAIFGSLVSLALLFIAVSNEARMSVLMAALMSGNLATGISNTIYLMAKNSDFFPIRKSDLKIKDMRGLAGTGIYFLLLQLNAGILLNADNIIIGKMLGADRIGDYAITVKLIGILITINSILLQPLWPAYREAVSRGDKDWAFITLIRSISQSLIIVLSLGGVLLLFFDNISSTWLGRKLSVSSTLVFGLILWCAAESVTMCLATFLNAMGALFKQVIVGWLFILMSIPMKIYLLAQYDVDLMPWATACLQALIVIIPLAVFCRRIQLEGSINGNS